MHLEVGNENWQRAASCYVRMEVFVIERNIDIADEFDDLDLPETQYVVIYDEVRPVSTGRIFIEDEQTIRPTRIATLKEYRGKQLGTMVITAIEEYGLRKGLSKSLIHAEVSAIPFYEKLGYQISSEIYYEDGVPCQNLTKQLTLGE